MKTTRLSLFIALALGCTARAGVGGGGPFVDPDAGGGGDSGAVTGDAPVTGDDAVVPGDGPVTGDDAAVPGDVPVAGDVPPTPCTGDESCGAARFCDNGQCRPQVCMPGVTACAGATAIAICDPRGSARVEMPCPGGAACADGRCQSPRVCEPGAATCASGTSRRVCTPDGTGYMTVACASGEQCTDGACRATQVCVPNTASCGADGARRVCNAGGTGYTPAPCGVVTNATTSCQDGRCVASCSAGFGNCDGVAENGCEVSLQSSVANCGACGNACVAGQSCAAGTCTGGGSTGANFRVSTFGTTGCATLDHNGTTGDDRGPIAALNGYLLITGDNATASINQTTQQIAPVPLMLDWIASNVRTGDLVVFTVGATLLPVSTGGTATHVTIVNPTTALPIGTPIPLSQSILINNATGFFAGWDRVVVWSGSNLYDVSLPSGAVRVLSTTWSMPTYNPCEIGSGLWGIAETQGSETDLVYVQNNTTIARTRVSTRATTTAGTFTNLGDMCGISVLPSAGRWYFHHEGASQFNSVGAEVAGWCPATTTSTGPSCTAPEADCGSGCVNTQSSVAHCGRCGNACAAGQSCVAGTCTGGTTAGYTRSTPTIAWTDACTLPSAMRVLPSLDDGTSNVTLPFTFRYWGRAATTVTIASNGYLSFDGSGASTGGSLPGAELPNAVVAPWWVDLRTSASGVCHVVTGTAPNRVFIAQWTAATNYSGGAGPLTFQVRLSETTNVIDFVYNSLVSPPANYYPAVGIENWEGTQAVAVCAGYSAMTTCSTVTPSTRYRFTPN